MRIDCPHCATAYEVPGPVLARKRLVRCANCGKDWAPTDAQDGVARALPSEDAGPALVSVPALVSAAPLASPPLAPQAPSAPTSKPGASRHALLAAWTASLAVLALAAWSAFAWRTPVMHAWPPSARLYKAVGLG